VLILEPGGESDAFVSRYDQSLSYTTDSWHSTREQALVDLEEEFGDNLGDSKPVPADERDPEGFVLKRLASPN
jgi:hypothetical protein